MVRFCYRKSLKCIFIVLQIAGSLLSAFGGPLAGMFMLGAFCPWANETVCIKI